MFIRLVSGLSKGERAVFFETAVAVETIAYSSVGSCATIAKPFPPLVNPPPPLASVGTYNIVVITNYQTNNPLPFAGHYFQTKHNPLPIRSIVSNK